jgi:dihydrofolate synthase/folylpolyglutamate synthase
VVARRTPNGAGYRGAVAELERALTFGVHPSLDGIRTLTDSLGRPQDAFGSIQVTGTNGKTSVTRLVEAILRGEGLKMGAYTSPHLVSYTERIEVDGVPVSEADFADAVFAVLEAAVPVIGKTQGEPAAEFTEFELLTAAALVLFRQFAVDFAVLEVGMGGRWDATSVVMPTVAVVTGVGLDHTERLGTTTEEIAFDKAHVIRPASAPVLGPATFGVADIFMARVRETGTIPRFVTEQGGPSLGTESLTVRFRTTERPAGLDGVLELDVHGIHANYRGLRLRAPSYQAANVAVAVAAAEAAIGGALDRNALRRSLADVGFPGRFEVARVAPPLVLDGAHNPQAAAVLATAIEEAFAGARPVAVLGVLSDKDAAGMIAQLARHVCGFIATQPDSPRALPAHELAVLIEQMTGTPASTYPRLSEALDAATGAAAGAVVTGSLYTVGEAKALLEQAG